jgi:hypothetical protein
MVPGWLLALKPSANALLVYCTLASFGRFDTTEGVYEECRPPLAAICERSGMSLSPVKRAIQELLELGAITRQQRWSDDDRTQLPSVYRVMFGALVGPGGSPDGRGSPSAGGLPPRPHGGQNQEPSTQKKGTQKKDVPDADASGAAAGEPQQPENAATVLAEYVDWLAAKNVKIPRQYMGRFGKEIKGCLDAGIPPQVVKFGLALLYERGRTSNPALVPAMVTEVQQRMTGHKPMKRESEFETAADRQQTERDETRRAEQYLKDQGIPFSYLALTRAKETLRSMGQQFAIGGSA